MLSVIIERNEERCLSHKDVSRLAVDAICPARKRTVKMGYCVSRAVLITEGVTGSGMQFGLPKPEMRVRFPSPAPLIIKDLRKNATKVQVNRALDISHYF